MLRHRLIVPCPFGLWTIVKVSSTRAKIVGKEMSILDHPEVRALLSIGPMVFVCSAVAGCSIATTTSTDLGSETDTIDAGSETGPEEEILVVPDPLPIEEADGFCVLLESDEVLASVTPEGHAWLLTPGPTEQAVRVVDPLVPDQIEEGSLEIQEVSHILAWTQDDASILNADGLWEIGELSRTKVTQPTSVTETTSICGTFGHHGVLIAAGSIHELRDESWWFWDGLAEDSKAPKTLITYDGDCTGRDNLTRVLGVDGTLLELGASSYFLSRTFARAAQAAATDALVGVLEEDALHIGPAPWKTWTFDKGVPGFISASGGRLWLARDERILRFDGEAFVEITSDFSGAITGLYAYASGAWVATAEEVCHISTESLIRVEGVRPHQRTTEPKHEISIRSSLPNPQISGTLDGDDVVLSWDALSSAMTGEIELPSVGWHDLVVRSGETERRIPLKRLPTVVRSWREDIEPIYKATCASATCHAETSEAAPPLHNHEAWVRKRQQINNRVVLAGTMPPSTEQGEDWPEMRTAIAEWLEGGMLP